MTDLNSSDVVAFRKNHGRLATVTTVPPLVALRQRRVQQDGSVNQFLEKPRSDGWVSAGFFVLDRGAFDYLGGDDCIFEREPLERLAADGQLMAY